jgi:molybdopterin-guanine dinucleotide biosynthesis protein A
VRNEEQSKKIQEAGIRVQAHVSFVHDLAMFPGGVRGDAAIFGLYSTFLAAREPFVLVISGDMPFVNVDVVELLAAKLQFGSNAVIPRWENGFLEPTLAIYAVKPARDRVEKMLFEKQYQLVEIARGLQDVIHVPIAELKQLDPQLACLVNVNDEKDLEQARELYEERMKRK